MSSMSELWWEKKLNIKTSGKTDRFIEEACNPYEPTDYRILKALVDSGYICSDSHVLDYGCGLGRAAIFLCAETGCSLWMRSTARISMTNMTGGRGSWSLRWGEGSGREG